MTWLSVIIAALILDYGCTNIAHALQDIAQAIRARKENWYDQASS